MFLSKDDGKPLTPVVKTATPELIACAKEVLADTVKLYLKAQGYHWNVKGADFSQYHSLFNSIYEYWDEVKDAAAENILKLGSDSPTTLMEFQMLSSIKDAQPADSPLDMARDLLAGHEQILICLNKCFTAATNANEQGIANFTADVIDNAQKWQWQLRSSVMQKAAPYKTEDGVQYPAEAFAYVPDPSMPSTWKLRLWDNLTEKETARQIGAAVAALGAGFRGQKVQLPDADRPAVIARVRSAWKKVHPADETLPPVLQ